MIVLEEPYVSKGLLEYLRGSRIPVLRNQFSEELSLNGNRLNLINEFDFIGQYHQSKKIYTVSEHALDWVISTLNDYDLNQQIALLKNKAAFREKCLPLYPGFFFQELSYMELFTFDFSSLQFPLVLKPVVGFLSAGVYIIHNNEDWANALIDIRENFEAQAQKFPETVVGSDTFILESYVNGKEFAIDLYFRGKEPVIINIFEHPFFSTKDVSDRLYTTNKEIFDNYLTFFTAYMGHLNEVLGLENIAVHIELRIDNGLVVPIEINPLRFAGMCLNEINYYITGKHPLHYFFTDTTPDYANMWKGKEDETYCFSILEKSESTEKNSFDINSIKEIYSDILEVRTIEDTNLNIHAFVFSKTNCKNELENILELSV